MGETNQTGSGEGLRGFVTDRHFAMAEEEFPGIARFYSLSSPKPVTFLELVVRYQRAVDSGALAVSRQ